MQVEISTLEARQVAAVRLVGPWHETAPRGFARLGEWVCQHQLNGDWLALYYDNPDIVPAEQLRIDTGTTVPSGFVLPPESDDIELRAVPGGTYGVAKVTVSDGNFAKPWLEFYDEWLPTSGYQRAEGLCFDRYLNDGSQSGIWEFCICVPLIKKPE
ncbi:DNA gyrase inhibitor SbmC [Erwinia sorbitola]|uniref:DNA gyrase inhibitor n=1 Tax=Erwinia sorbitola TaxID=2681984 RepID=A0ABW9R8B2_9GAMM|nr:DNA gyrase inhibitor SbmC [Erwinia sorbitola]MTD26373.1 DNA gyrase inhibitor SbmC [Erwinia sorbitola]